MVARNYLVDPVLAVDIVDAAVECVGCEHEEEIACLSYGVQQVVVKLASLQPLHVDEH